MMQYQRTVNSLAVKLDTVKPGWAYLVDTDRLNLMSGTDCLLGQVFAGEARSYGGSSYSGYAWAYFGRTLAHPDRSVTRC